MVAQRFILLLLLAGLTIPASSQAQSDSTHVELTFSSALIFPGDTVEVVMDAADMSGLGISAYSFDIQWDDSLLAFVEATIDSTISGPDAAGMTLFFHSDTTNQVTVVGAGATAIEGSGPLIRLKFESLGSEGVTSVDLFDSLLNEGEVTSTSVAGEIEIKPADIGDITKNREISAYDASRILEHAAQLNLIPEEDLHLADVTGNDIVSAYDAAFILQYTVGLISCFEADPTCSASKGKQGEDLGQLAWEPAASGWTLDYAPASDDVLALSFEIYQPGLSEEALQFNVPDDWQATTRQVDDETWRVVMAGITPLAGGSILALAGSAPRTHFTMLNETSIHLQDPSATPKEVELEQNYPNPFNPATQIAYSLPEASHVRLVVYDALGREVARLVDYAQNAGRHSITFNAENQPSGLYFYQLETADRVETRQMLLVK